MKPIRILTPDLELVGEIDNYSSLVFCRKYHAPGEFQLVTNIKVQNAQALQKNNFIMLGADKNKVGIIRHREIGTNEKGEEILQIKGYALGHIMSQRITIPPDGQAQDIQEADAETVMKHYVQRNCLDVPGMEFSNLVVAENQHRAGIIKWQSRYKNLSEELEKISKVSGLGWGVHIDSNLNKWIFDVYMGKNLSVNQQINPPVIFSPEFDNIDSQDLTDSLIGYFNFAIVGGKGEGAAREIVAVGTEATGLDRYVTFIDARDIEDSEDLQERGMAKLLEYEKITSFNSKISQSGPFKYEKDWNLGDVVTVQNKSWGITMDVRVTQVEEIYEEEGFKLKATFGEGIPTLIQKIRSSLSDLNVESTK